MICTMRVSCMPVLGDEENSPLTILVGEGNFDDQSAKPSGAVTPVPVADAGPPSKRKKGMTKKAKTLAARLAVADGGADPDTFQ